MIKSRFMKRYCQKRFYYYTHEHKKIQTRDDFILF